MGAVRSLTKTSKHNIMNKNTKVFFGDKPIMWRNQHAKISPLQALKVKSIRLAKRSAQWFILASVIAGTISLSFILGQYNIAKTIHAQSIAPTSIDPLNRKIEALKDDVVAQIRSCESAGHKEDEGIIILDTNNKMSIGQLQFQKATVIYYYKTLYNKIITAKEATNIALDSTLASQLAKDILFKTKTGTLNWINCSIKYHSKEQVEIINKLSK